MSLAILDVWAGVSNVTRSIHILMLLLSTTSVFIIGERTLALARSKRASRRYAESVAERFIDDGEVASVASPGADPGYIGRVIEAGIAALRTSPCTDERLTLERVARALERQGRRELQQLRRGRSLLVTVCATTPCVGMLGSMLGIVTTLQGLAASESPALTALAAGVADALATTIYGLCVAIPALCAFSLWSGFIEERAVDIAESSSEFLDFVARRARSRAAAARALPPRA